MFKTKSGVISSQDRDESDVIDGTIEKKGYRQRWVREVKKAKNAEHPFNHGIHMDTHHIISAEAVNQSDLGDDLIRKGYNINLLENLVGLPATLPAACQLQCQLHRGDHTYARPKERPYHEHVAKLLLKKEDNILNCYGRTKVREKNTEIHKLLDPMSVAILEKINKFKLPITKIYKNFHPDSVIGCGNHFDVNDSELSGYKCKSKRKHYRTSQRLGIDKRYQDSDVTGNEKTITFIGTWVPEVKK
ncbi:AHH domain-containing protein [Photobacterium nomapromontoriensis]|uniref:AHH domain-containing protein n=1 Tax=Photobacterium nomapromontoriensis TaxID=2910237 RepID=UPI003D0EDEAD